MLSIRDARIQVKRSLSYKVPRACPWVSTWSVDVTGTVNTGVGLTSPLRGLLWLKSPLLDLPPENSAKS
jgi:hypothetical protein